MAVHGSRESHVRTPLVRLVAGGALVAGFAIALLTHRASGTERVVDELLAHRFTAGRLSGQSAWAKCAITDSTALAPPTVCEAPPARSTLRVSPADSSPDGLRGRALLQLRFGADLVEKHQAAVDTLTRAVAADPESASLLNDLAVAYLELAELTQQLEPMKRAFEHVEHAFAIDSLQLPVLFNRALIHQRLYIIDGAAQAWRRYLALEDDPRWLQEAQANLRYLQSVPDTISWDALLDETPPQIDAVSRSVIRFRVARAPQTAREFGFPLLAAWGSAVLAGDTARAARLLEVAREIGDALVDESVALGVAAIDSAALDATRLGALARGHVGLAKADSLNSAKDYEGLAPQAETAERELELGGSPMARWASFYRACAEVNDRQYERADPRLRGLIERAGPEEFALEGKAHWGLGLSHFRRGIHSEAIRSYREAAPFIARVREVENQGSLQTLLAEVLADSGYPLAADSAAYRALRLLAPYRELGRLGNLLDIVAAYTRESGLNHAAMGFENEAIRVARAQGDPNSLALFHSARAQDHEAVGNWSAAEGDIREANRWSSEIPAGPAGDRVRAKVRLAVGEVTQRHDPVAGLALLRNAVQTYTSTESDLYLPRALHAAARAARAVGDVAQARAWLEQAMEHVEEQRAAFQRVQERFAFYVTVEEVFDAAVALEVDAGNAAKAFEILERGRGLWAGAENGAPLPPLGRIGRALPENTLLVDYALLADTVVISTASRREARQHIVAVSRREIAALAERIRRDTSAAALRGRPGSPTARLFDLLILPIKPQLAAGTRLIIVPDRELFGVPFAALWDTAAGRYLVQNHALSTVPSAAFYLRAVERDRRLPDGASALIVGDPMLSAKQRVDLPPLQWAEREAVSVAREYGEFTLLQDSTARRDRVQELLDDHSIFHFAGHAVFNPEQPEESYLAMAGDGSPNSGLMLAREIGELSLSNLQVVVLSACSTLGQRATRSGPAAGLAFSFLRAGAPATVSSLWDVDDSATSPLLVDFHRHLAAGRRTPAEALREAQVAAIGDGISPRAWAAFVYTGP